MILSYLRTILLYLVLIFCIRLMGKRQIGEMEPTEFVVTMLLANLAAIPMQDGAIPLYSGLVPILTVLGMELVLSGLILRSVVLRRFLCGKPVILIDNGKIIQDNLRRTRVTLDEAEENLRIFGNTWRKQYPSCVKSWEDNWEVLNTFFEYPPEIRKIIYTTNIIEGLNRQFR